MSEDRFHHQGDALVLRLRCLGGAGAGLGDGCVPGKLGQKQSRRVICWTKARLGSSDCLAWEALGLALVMASQEKLSEGHFLHQGDCFAWVALGLAFVMAVSLDSPFENGIPEEVVGGLFPTPGQGFGLATASLGWRWGYA